MRRNWWPARAAAAAPTCAWGSVPDPAAQVVARALVRQAARLIAEGRWEAELLAEVEPEA